jgi:hypothetical protein
MQIAYNKQVSLPWLMKLYGEMVNGQTVCFEPLMDRSSCLVLLILSSLSKVNGQTVSFDGGVAAGAGNLAPQRIPAG